MAESPYTPDQPDAAVSCVDKGWRKWFPFHLISCKQYTELACRELIEPLTAKERLAFRFHHIICLMCRRFRRQITAIDHGAKKLCDEQLGDAESINLSQSVCQRIEKALKEEMARQSRV